jgi:hypothetical protein
VHAIADDGAGSLLPTPIASDSERGERMGGRTPGLKEKLRKGLLPTPTAGDADCSGSRNLPGSKAHKGTSLTDAVRRPHLLPTPSAGDGRKRGRLSHPDLKRLLPTPDARCWKSGKGRKENGHSPQLEAIAGGQLSVPFVEQMMGVPTRWTALTVSARSATRRSRSKPRPRSRS